MRTRTVAVLAFVLLALGGVAAYGFVGTTAGGELREQWVSDTAREMTGNHHAPAVAEIDGQQFVFAPVSGPDGADNCGLYALSGDDGSTEWVYEVPPTNCTIHSVADPTVADFDGDGSREALAATTERVVFAASAADGTVEFRHNLSSYGYTEPVVADFVPGGGKEVVVADVQGTLFVVHENGTTAWSKQLGMTWAAPELSDFDGDGTDELVVGSAPGTEGTVTVLEPNGSVTWQRTVAGSVGWLATSETDGQHRIVAATTDGRVAAYAGNGTRVWNHEFGKAAAVHAIGDGDGDGTSEVYAVAKDGKLRAIDTASGAIEWTTTLTNADVTMMPPPTLADVDGDDSPELLAPSKDGMVSVVAPESGDVLATYERDVPIFKYPAVADLDGDGDDEALVMYGDGRVVALDYTQ
ncbi:outer membrane protein assembly factor BamB family protein [Halorussus halophilus]|uniref:outer membrane protein assembly factor BamB family protein n=1 Tax=Halorussus halophilus TaxID=2650975 RepID=UPI0013018EFA|nr:PQQ-binding-like beta-propeller repeat protein [Halorussus halophilus]